MKLGTQGPILTNANQHYQYSLSDYPFPFVLWELKGCTRDIHLQHLLNFQCFFLMFETPLGVDKVQLTLLFFIFFQII